MTFKWLEHSQKLVN